MKRAKQAKKTARKVVRKRQTKAQIAAQTEARVRASLRASDPYYLAPGLIPVGWSYQWKIDGATPPTGWTCVPFSRHAHDFPRDFQNLFGQIAFLGLVLMEATAEQAEKEASRPRVAATEMYDAHPAARKRGRYDGFPLMPEDWIETEKIPDGAEQNEGPPVEVAVTLLMRVPVRWNSAALYLNLTLNEYVRRHILMERPVLGCLDPFSPEAVYETVNVQIKGT